MNLPDLTLPSSTASNGPNDFSWLDHEKHTVALQKLIHQDKMAVAEQKDNEDGGSREKEEEEHEFQWAMTAFEATDALVDFNKRERHLMLDRSAENRAHHPGKID